MRRRVHSLRRALRHEEGFTMVTVLGAMLVVLMASAAAIGAATSDLGGGARDKATKQALSAAEAGINDYSYHLTLNNNYWSLCEDVPDPAKVGQANATLKWRGLPGTNAQYAIELLPANGQARCERTNASGTMIDASTGTFRIRTTGRVPTGKNSAGVTTYATRTLVTTYRRKGFLDFLYFTNYETSDPAWYKLETGGRATRNNSSDSSTTRLLDWATANCATYYRDGRASRSWSGQINTSGTNWANKSNVRCNEIQFASDDEVKGPLHTNDSLLVCGTPTFGRNSTELIEVEAQTSSLGGAWRENCSGSDPNFVGTLRPGATHLEPPTSNSSLKTTVAPAYFFTGATRIVLNATTDKMTVTNRDFGTRILDFPSNGVVFVADGTQGCGSQYDPLNPSTYDTTATRGCGNAFVKGSYGKDLTIAAESDVVIEGGITKANDRVLGLIANQFVRVQHPVTNFNSSISSGGNVSTSCTNVNSNASLRIDAAILALNHSFTVDYYFCGSPLGTLTVDGVIAQKFRGPVGTGSGGGIATGYIKNYIYDNRLSLRQPPHFLDPVQASWRVTRQTEQAR